MALPTVGVYAAYAWLGARQWSIMAHVEPSSAGTERHLAVHMPHWADDLYGQSLRVEFVRRLRPEVRLASAKALAEQMEKTPAQVRQVLSPV